MGIGEYIYKLKANDEAAFYSPLDIKALVVVSKNTEERMFVVDPGVFNAHAEQEGLELRGTGYSEKTQKPYKESDRKWENVKANEKAQVRVHDLDLFVTVTLLEGTPAVLPPRKLCSEHGCSCE